MPQDQWPRIAVMGAGAVGCYFGGMLARAGAPVTLIGRAQHVAVMAQKGLCLESMTFRAQIPVAAITDPSGAREAAIVLLCVKSPDTVEAILALAPHLPPKTIVVSLQNGVDNIEQIRAASGIDAVPAVVYVAAEMTAPGHVKHTGRGDLIIGDFTKPADGDPDPRRLAYLAALFARAGIPCQVSDNIAGDLWMKLIMNCAYNAISALSRARYGAIITNAPMREVMVRVTQEVLAVAQAAGVRLLEVDPIAAVFRLGEAMTAARSSTAQDLARGKRTEIDALNGYIARRGVELGVATPVNQALYALVKMLEESTAEGASF